MRECGEHVPRSDIKVYARRWFLMGIFMWFSACVSAHWTQFATISNIVSRHYDVPGVWVESTAMMCMAARGFLLFPALFLIEKLETRNTLILASVSCLIGCIIKAFSVSPDRFYLALVGQVFAALSVTFTYCIVGRFSAAWLSSDEISTVGALGCVGDQLGGVLGFVLPNLFVPQTSNMEDVTRGMQLMHYIYLAYASVTVVLNVMFFKSAPERPPSVAQVQNRAKESESAWTSVKTIMRNPHFLLFTISHATLVGAGCNGIGTLLNVMIVTNFPGYEMHTGTIGGLYMIAGMTGSVVVSYILDKSRKFKGNADTLAALSSILLALFAISLKLKNVLYVYLTYTIFGFFVLAYYSTGIQMGIELTFPIPEGTTVATMSVCIELCSVISTIVFGYSVRRYGDFISCVCTSFVMCATTMLVCLVPPKFKREEVEKLAKSIDMKEFSSGAIVDVVQAPSY